MQIMNAIKTTCQIESSIAHFVRRGAMLIALLFAFVAGVRAQKYYVIYYDDTSTNPATRHYLSISEDGNSVEDATTFSDRCIWVAPVELSIANESSEGKFKANGDPDKANRANRRVLSSFTSLNYCLIAADFSQEKADEGEAVSLKTSSGDDPRWLIGDGDVPVLYTYYYNCYVYYDSGWKISSNADKYSNRAKIEICTDLPPSPVNIACAASGEKLKISLTSDPDCSIYYTDNGENPTKNSKPYDGTFEDVDWGTTIKAISVRGEKVSEVAKLVLPKKNEVALDDRESHGWSYYQEGSPISSPNPCDVKITYLGGGITLASGETENANAAVGIDAPETSLVYKRTLEKDGDGYPYTTIANPFSKRPTGKGFNRWKISKLKNCTIKDAEGNNITDYVSADAQIIISPSDECSAEIEFEAEWVDAKIIMCAAEEVNTALVNEALANGTYETNIIVVTSGMYKNSLPANHYPATITMVRPDGSFDYRNIHNFFASSNIKLYKDLKFEYINMRDISTIDANANDLILGRGITHPYNSTGVNASTIKGLNEGKSENLDYLLRIESGLYNTLYFVSTSKECSGSSKRIRSILGCDYDRANKDDNQMKIFGQTTMGTGMTFSGNTFESSSFFAIVKSGTFNASMTSAGTAAASEAFYISMSNNPTDAGSRTLIIEGGTFWNIAGGVDTNENLMETGYDQTSVYIRMKGGNVRGSIYGGGAYAEGYGNRKMVFTGGTVGGWIAAGCNGTQTSGGKTYGSSQIYVGGNTKVTKANNSNINGAGKGQVFGAGKGYAETDNDQLEQATSGEMTYGTTVVIADNASVAGDVYGGGFYGYALNNSSNVYVLGGIIGGTVYGGSNMKGGAPTNVTIAGGTIQGNVYGGSNTKGEIKSTNILMSGGSVSNNIFGGGNNAPVGGDATVTITSGTVTGNVYGGGDKAAVGGQTKVIVGSLGQ